MACYVGDSDGLSFVVKTWQRHGMEVEVSRLPILLFKHQCSLDDGAHGLELSFVDPEGGSPSLAWCKPPDEPPGSRRLCVKFSRVWPLGWLCKVKIDGTDVQMSEINWAVNREWLKNLLK